MFLLAVLRNALRLLLPLAVAQTFYIYLYPVFLGCAFPLPFEGTVGVDIPSPNTWPAFLEAARQHAPLPIPPLTSNAASPAPFRLLALGDPQLEGDTSIPNLRGPRLPHFKKLIQHATFQSKHDSLRLRIKQFLHDYVEALFEDIPNEIESIRKHIDLFGNDFYLAHVYRTVHWWTKPTHVSVLGDLVGSQWIRDDEFERRGARFWNRVFRGAERIPDEFMTYPAMDYDLAAVLGQDKEEDLAWTRRAINVAGNHDIGYAGDINKNRFERFERVFGKANYELRFELPVDDPVLNATMFDEEINVDSDKLPPELRIVVLNDMNLDTPARDSELQDATYKFLNDVIKTSTAVEYKGHFTVVLTHIPLLKREGLCVDSPFFSFHDGDNGVKEQNMLSGDASKGFLEGIFGMSGDPGAPGKGRGRPGVILNGHDHEGCDTYHFIRQKSQGNRYWEAQRWEDAKANKTMGLEDAPGIREITVRSMMGDFGGNAGLLSAWFDHETWSWKYEYATCALGRQHLWWAVHIIDLITVVIAAVYGVLLAVGVSNGGKKAVGPRVVSKASPADQPKLGGTSVSPKQNGVVTAQKPGEKDTP